VARWATSAEKFRFLAVNDRFGAANRPQFGQDRTFDGSKCPPVSCHSSYPLFYGTKGFVFG